MQEIEKDKIYNIDCLEFLNAEIFSGGGRAFDAVITDPPYGINFASNHRKEKFEVIANDNLTEAEFEALLNSYFQGCYKLLNDDSFLITFMGWQTTDIFKRALLGAGFTIEKMPIWVKNNFGLGYYMRPQYEPMYLCLKGKPAPPKTAISDVLHFPKVKDLIHSCQKPLDLICKLITTFTNPGDLIFDGFMGSGTTAAAAIRMQRHYIGCEIDKTSYENAINRINTIKAQPTIFDLLGGQD